MSMGRVWPRLGKYKKLKSVHPSVATAHLPQKEASGITSINPLGKNDNSRWYHNCLTNNARVLNFKSKDEKFTPSKFDENYIANLREKII